MSDSKEIIESGKDLTPEFPLRQFTKGDEPNPDVSIGYFSKPKTLFEALRRVLYDDEWQELQDSRLGIFIRFYEADVSWASRLVHFIFGFQLVCKKKHEIWSLIGVTPIRFSLHEFSHITGLNCDYIEKLMSPEVEVTDELTNFWELIGVDSNAGPSYEQLEEVCERDLLEWSRDDRLRLGYLCILAAFIDAKSHKSAIDVNLARLVMDLGRFVDYPWGRVAFKTLITSVKRADITHTYHLDGFAQALQSWVFFALPKYAKEFGQPTKTEEAIPLLAFGGAKGRKQMKDKMMKQTEIVSYVDKEFDDMFPLWDDDGQDEKIVNILKACYGQFSKKPWIWRRSHWPREGVKASNNKVVVKQEAGQGVKREAETTEEDGTTSKKARIESSFAEFEKRLTESLKVLVDSRLEMFENGVNMSFGELGIRIDNVSRQVQEVNAKISELNRGEDEGNNGDAVNLEAKTNVHPAGARDGGSANEENDLKVPPQGQEPSVASVPPQDPEPSVASVPQHDPEPSAASVVMLHKSQVDVDFDEKREKQTIKEKTTQAKAAALVAKGLREKQKQPSVKVQIADPPTRGRGYDPFNPLKRERRHLLLEFLKTCPEGMAKEPKYGSTTWFYRTLRTEAEWLWDQQVNTGIKLLRQRYHVHPERFRNDKLSFLDSFFTQLWRSKYEDFQKSDENQYGTGKIVPPNAFDLFTGDLPEFCQSKKRWGLDIEEIYAPVNLHNTHWVAMHVSIKKRHITVFDCIVGDNLPDLESALKPMCELIPYVIHLCVPAELREVYSPFPYTWDRLPADKVAQNKQIGDCGVYTLKLIELHALGYPLDDKNLCDGHIKQIRERYAVDFFTELNVKGTEQEDDNVNLGVYERT